MANHDAHQDGHEEHHGLSHVATPKVLLGTWVALMILTVITVGATKVDFGSSMNLGLAMAIAVVKATLVVTFFMHLKYDRFFHTICLVGALLAATLFVGFTLMDSNQYQESIIWDPHTPPQAPYGPRPQLP